MTSPHCALRARLVIEHEPSGCKSMGVVQYPDCPRRQGGRGAAQGRAHCTVPVPAPVGARWWLFTHHSKLPVPVPVPVKAHVNDPTTQNGPTSPTLMPQRANGPPDVPILHFISMFVFPRSGARGPVRAALALTVVTAHTPRRTPLPLPAGRCRRAGAGSVCTAVYDALYRYNVRGERR